MTQSELEEMRADHRLGVLRGDDIGRGLAVRLHRHLGKALEEYALLEALSVKAMEALSAGTGEMSESRLAMAALQAEMKALQNLCLALEEKLAGVAVLH